MVCACTRARMCVRTCSCVCVRLCARLHVRVYACVGVLSVASAVVERPVPPLRMEVWVRYKFPVLVLLFITKL